jgi:RHS repeat-associated protein
MSAAACFIGLDAHRAADGMRREQWVSRPAWRGAEVLRSVIACLSFCIAGAIASAHAANGAEPAAAESSCKPGELGTPCASVQVAGIDATGGAQQGAGNPVNLISGDKYQRETDMAALPGILGLELVRHYHSRRAAPGMPAVDIGRGWALSYDTRLYRRGDSVQILQADGARLVFGRSAGSSRLWMSADGARGVVRSIRIDGIDEYRWFWPDGRMLHFDRNGRLGHIVAPGGEILSIRRLEDGRLWKVRDPQGRSLVFHYPARGGYPGIERVDTPVGSFRFGYGGADAAVAANLVAVQAPGGARRLYHYEDARFPALLTGISVAGDAAQQRISTWAYDRNGYAVLSEHRGERLHFDRSRPGITQVADERGQITLYRHGIVAGELRMLEARGAGCASCGPVNLRYGYDGRGRLAEVTWLDAAGMPLEGRRRELDDLGRAYAIKRISYRNGKPARRSLLLRRVYPAASPWHAAGRADSPNSIAMNSVLPGRDHRWQIEYNAARQPLAVTESGFNPEDGSELRRVTRYRYREIRGRSLLVEIDGPLPNGPAGTPADSDVTRYEWDARGDFITRVIRPMGATIDIERDAATGRPAAIRYRWGDAARRNLYDYSPSGQLRRLREQALAADGETVLDERETRIEANALDEVSRIVWPDGGSDELGRAQLMPEPQRAPPGLPGLQAIYGDGLTAAAGEVSQIEANGKSAERIIDDFDQVIAIRNPGQGWKHARHDEAGRIIEIRDPRGASTNAGYDAAGRLLRVERALPGAAAPQRLEFAWNGPCRVRETVLEGERRMHERRIGYTLWGQVAGIRVEIAAAESGAVAAVMEMHSWYDAAGRLSARTLPGGERLAYRYYASAPYRGQRAAIEQLHWPRALDWLMTRLPESWLDRLRWKTRLADFAPQESAGMQAATLALQDAHAAPQVEPGLSAQAPGELPDAAGLPQRLVTAKGSFDLRWDAAGRLASVHVGKKEGQRYSVAGYAYDALGRRASKHSAAGSEYYLYEGTQLLAVAHVGRDGATTLAQFLYEGLRPVVWLRDGIVYRLQTDHRGALQAVLSVEKDRKGSAPLWQAGLDAWGAARGQPDERFDPHLRLLNQYADPETGLSYHIARYYDPSRGRFISPDPGGIGDSIDAQVPAALKLDITVYAAGQPWLYVDLDGAAKLTYYAITTAANGNQLGNAQGFTRARWAFSIEGIEASGDGGNEAVNKLMEKYAAEKTELLFDKGGNFLDKGKNFITWNGSENESVDLFVKHYGGNLISMRQFEIYNYSNKDAALLIASLLQDKDGVGLCNNVNDLLPPISFGYAEDDLLVTRMKGVDPNSPANLQRILNCNANDLTALKISYANDLERERVERIEAAAEMNETAGLNKDCSVDGCPGMTIFGQRGSNGEVPREYHASYGRSQFVGATFIETLDRLPAEDKAAVGITEDLQRRIAAARRRAESISRERVGLFYVARHFSCQDATAAWDDVGTDGALTNQERISFESVYLDRQAFVDMVCFVPGGARTLAEGRNAFMTFSIFGDPVLQGWLMSLYKSFDDFNLVSRTFIRNNLRMVIASNALQEGLKNKELPLLETGAVNPKFKVRQREIEQEIAMRVARLHNGGGEPLSVNIDNVTRSCKIGRPCDSGDYVKTFIGGNPGRGDWRSLRCGDIGGFRGLQLLPIDLREKKK